MQSDVLPPPLPERHHTGDQSRVCSKRNLSRKTAKIFVCILQACEISNYFRRMNEAKNAKKKRNFAKKSRKFRIFANFFSRRPWCWSCFLLFLMNFRKNFAFFKISDFFNEMFAFFSWNFSISYSAKICIFSRKRLKRNFAKRFFLIAANPRSKRARCDHIWAQDGIGRYWTKCIMYMFINRIREKVLYYWIE